MTNPITMTKDFLVFKVCSNKPIQDIRFVQTNQDESLKHGSKSYLDKLALVYLSLDESNNLIGG